MFQVPSSNWGLCWRMVYELSLCCMLNAKHIQILFYFFLQYLLETGLRVSLTFGHKKRMKEIERNFEHYISIMLWNDIASFYHTQNTHISHSCESNCEPLVDVVWYSNCCCCCCCWCYCYFMCGCCCFHREINEIYGEAH